MPLDPAFDTDCAVMVPAPVEPRLLQYEQPYDWPSMRAWLAARAIPGLEWVSDDGYARTLRVGATRAVVHVRHRPDVAAFEMAIVAPAPIDNAEVATRMRHVLDLDRDLVASTAPFVRDPQLVSVVSRHPGLRVPGGWEPFELAVRAVLGQQVTIGAARQLVATLVRTCGGRLPDARDTDPLNVVFPTAADVLAGSLDALRMPGSRKATLVALARTACDDPAVFQPSRPLDDIVSRLRGVRGVGDWTAHYIALRALGATDAFPASDVGLLRGAARVFGTRPSPAALLARADAWRPHRAYAAQLLWAEDCES